MQRAASADLELALGARLGRYVVGEPVGVGATAAVYRARDEETGAEVAIKRMLSTAHRARFEIELRLLSRLSHPRVVRVLDHVAAPDGPVMIVMELIDGTDLARVLWDRGAASLPADSVVRWAGEACEALHYVHQQQIVHGDVKPRNLMLAGRGIVLTDFGIASIAGGAGAASAGTPGFVAPEVFSGDPPSPVSDVYGLAATAWTLLAGRPPAFGEDARLEGAPPALEAALRRALSIDPAERPRSAEELARELGAARPALRGASLAASVDGHALARPIVEAVVRTAASVFEAAAASIALSDPAGGGLLYVAAWGAGADEIVGTRLAVGEGIAGAVARSGEAEVVAGCRTDPRFAARVAAATGYVPYTMLVLPLRCDGRTVGVLSLIDRRDGEPYLPADAQRAAPFGELAVTALDAGHRLRGG